MGLRLLLTNSNLWERGGTVIYTRDLALELRRQGHTVAAYTLTKGPLSAEMEQAGVPVVDNLRRLPFTPDVIHGHHYTPTLAALQHFPGVPGLFVCHHHVAAYDPAPFHPRLRRYFGVSRLCVQSVAQQGATAELLLNFVDLRRFVPRPPLPARPRRALVFSNYAHAETQLPAITQACQAAGLELDVVGSATGTSAAQPEAVLGHYDLVFAKAKAAMEAMAVGTAVVLCDFGGVGPLVTSADFNRLRPLNFGFEALTEPLQAAPLLRQIERYDAEDAARVRDQLRACAGLTQAAENLVGVYEEMIDEQQRQARGQPEARFNLHLGRQRLVGLIMREWTTRSPAQRKLLQRVPGVRLAGAVARRLLARH